MQKYCTSCMRMRPENAGRWIQTKVKRWQCVFCFERKNQSPYASKSTLKRWDEEQRK